MDKINEFLKSYLKHERIYDPVKAHDYYERTKVLKGRNGRKALRGQKKKEGWAYVQDQVRQRKKADLTGASDSNKAAVEQLRSTARQHRAALSEQIKALMSSITNDVASQIAALPKGMSKEEHKAAVDKIHADAKQGRDNNNLVRDEQRTQISSDLKATLETAKANYQAARNNIKAKYDTILNREYEALRKS